MTYFEAWDPEQRTALWLMTGPTNSDDDFQRNLDTMRRLDALAPDFACRCAVLIVDPGNPAPPPVWRRELADTAGALVHRQGFALVTSSAALRGALTALNWVRRPKGAALAVASVEEAARVLHEHTGQRLELSHLVHDVRRQAAPSMAG